MLVGSGALMVEELLVHSSFIQLSLPYGVDYVLFELVPHRQKCLFFWMDSLCMSFLYGMRVWMGNRVHDCDSFASPFFLGIVPSAVPKI